MQKPSVGRIVHYFSKPGAEPEAALIVHVWNDTCVNIVRWNSGGTKSDNSSLLLKGTPGAEGQHWDWPARVG